MEIVVDDLRIAGIVDEGDNDIAAYHLSARGRAADSESGVLPGLVRAAESDDDVGTVDQPTDLELLIDQRLTVCEDLKWN